MTDVSGRNAFITGGANGIGLAIAHAFADAGVKLGLVDIDGSALDHARIELSRKTEVEVAVLDMRDRDGFAGVADRFEERLGPISLLVNNAGVAGGAPIQKLSYDLWDWVMGINIGGVISGVQTLLPRMIERGLGGHVVNTASIAGLVIRESGIVYHTSKFAVVGLTDALRLELMPFDIGVTLLCPGPVATDIIARTRAAQPRSRRRVAQEVQADAITKNERMTEYLKRGADPADVGRMVFDAVLHNRPYIHTDDRGAPLIRKRCKALLEAMPTNP